MFDWTFVTHYAPFFVSGAEMTLFISVFGIVLSIVVGLICAGIEIARIPVLKHIVRVYIELSRNTPLLVQLYFLYFGLPKLGIVWSAEQCAIVGLASLAAPTWPKRCVAVSKPFRTCNANPRTCWASANGRP